MRVLVCGSRTFSNAQLVWDILRSQEYLGIECVIEGQCPYGGADAHAESWAKANKVEHLPFPVERDEGGRILGPKRNQQMLDEGRPDLVIAFIDKPLDESRGTRDMVTRARKAGVQTYVIEAIHASL